MLRGNCTFSMHPSWQEQGFWKILSINHFGEFLEKFACQSFLLKFQHFLPHTFNVQKWQYSRYGPFVPSPCIPHGRNKVSKKNCRSTILVNFWKKFVCPDLSFLSKFEHFLSLTFNLQKCQYSRYGALVPSLCIPHGRNKVSKIFCRSTILVNFWKNLHVRTLVFFRKFSTFFLTLLISKNANIHATGHLHLLYASLVAGTRFRKCWLCMHDK